MIYTRFIFMFTIVALAETTLQKQLKISFTGKSPE